MPSYHHELFDVVPRGLATVSPDSPDKGEDDEDEDKDKDS